ncbi:MAG: DNA polymerase III, subunit gamma and tau [Candidatus Sungbacteria bacterium RIFCSPHIGHO2_02_FULL_49_12]|uniref:DNA polymerase III subunit gamma/tau n=1 Tax=Candidatus Sungbacteria bacterium RIFCSPHIGHO2_02_FULL_49_12 TaxID=1802271 RepID=A0A1G2KT63_9BACT|nr:MAG: DNA polymerase III, subunit gamma and tau [Candidatus Sungbacteria bacterium RIFCSPHIGHO2_02_FULL_49_12]
MQEHLVLYRKYRPRGFNEIVGQESVVRTLSNAIASGRLAHAYLFSGPRGVGKTTIARLIAKAANCANAAKLSSGKLDGALLAHRNTDEGGSTRRSFSEGGLSVPCNTCPSCLLYNDGTALDLIEIDAASNRGIDEIRELRENLRYASSSGGKKTYIIDEVHMLTAPAFNALLKTLEEPPAHVIFVLATTEIHKVPATIISRTQHFEFRRPSVSAIAERLIKISTAERVKLDPAAARVIALAGEGSLRDAESILGQIMAVEDSRITEVEVEETLGLPRREAVMRFYQALVKKETAPALAVIEKIVDDGHDPEQFLRSAIRLSRNAIFLKLDPTLAASVSEELLPEETKELETLLQPVEASHLTRILSRLTAASDQIRISPLPELPLELAALEITKL